MSFSGEVKKELAAVKDLVRHCQLAEIAAMISGCGQIHRQGGRLHVTLAAENSQVVQRYAALLQQAVGITAVVAKAQPLQQKKKMTFVADIAEGEDVRKLFQMLKILGSDGQIRENLTLTDGLLLQKSCCKRAFLRGAFLTAGSMSNPKKSYHFEIVCATLEKATQLKNIICFFHIDAKIIQRKKYFVVYIKEGAQIVEILNVMEAHVALMNLENIRILKEMRNTVNRKVNCEAANINKTVFAAVKQMEDIKFIKNTIGFEKLAKGLQEIALLRLEHPEATLKELGTMLNPPVGKSGVNHRLRKLSEIAENIRD